MNKWTQLPNSKTLAATVAALKASGIDAEVVDTAAAAKARVLELIPAHSEVMTMTSKTLEAVGLADEINNKDGNFQPVRDKMFAMDPKTQHTEMNKLGAASEYTLGSVHAVTEDGKVVVASNTGSQLPAYAYGSPHVIWVVGAQKIVKNLDEAMTRIYEYVLPLESERAHQAYGVAGSNVSKLLIFNKEVNPSRLKMILVKEQLGF